MSYTVNGVKYDEFSSKNQKILDGLVNREVYCCMTGEVEYMIERTQFYDDNNPIDENDLECLYQTECPACGAHGRFTETTVGEIPVSIFVDSQMTLYDNGEISGYVCPICGYSYESVGEAIECCGADEGLYVCPECNALYSGEDFSNLEMTVAEPFEWWAVSGWFGEKLKEVGCVVIDAWAKSYWGRETTGQAIALDWCIAEVAKKMKILEGMENEWKAV